MNAKLQGWFLAGQTVGRADLFYAAWQPRMVTDGNEVRASGLILMLIRTWEFNEYGQHTRGSSIK